MNNQFKKARIDPRSYVFLSGIMWILATLVLLRTVLDPKDGSYFVVLFLFGLGLVWYFLMASNSLQIENDTLILKPAFSRTMKFVPAEIKLVVSRSGFTSKTVNRPYFIRVISLKRAFRETGIPARLFYGSDIEEILKISKDLGAVIEG